MDEPNRTIDERLDFLLKSTETLHEDCRELYRVTHEHTLQLQEHSRRWNRVARAMRAGLEEWFNEGDEP